MKKILSVIVLSVAMGAVPASAQKFLNKVTKAVDKASETVTDVAETATEATSGTDVASLIAAVPTYEFRKVTMVDENGTALTNEDGTTQVRILIYQTNGDSTVAVSCDYAKRSIKKVLNSSLIKTAVKMGVTMLVGKGSGVAVIGGVAMSATDIIAIGKAGKSLGKFNKQLKVYEESFSEDGTLLDASADLDKLKIDLSETEDTGTPEGVAEMIASSNNAEEPDLDALLAAAADSSES